MHVRIAKSLLIITIPALLLAGCSGVDPNRPPMAKVSGVVTYNGNPVTNGEVIFTPVQGRGGETGQVATGQLGPDGSFNLTTFNTNDGAILGQHNVTVMARGEDINLLNQPGPSGEIAYVLPEPIVPKKYTSPETSPLRYTVEAETRNHFEIELTD